MKYHLPDDCAGLSHEGTQLSIADDGTVDLDAVAARALAPHGVVRVPDPTPGEGRDDEPSGKRDGSDRR